jgi:hypothetical protein
VSLSDIIQFVGTGSVPVFVAGTVYGVLELGEKLASQRAKDALSKWLLSFNVQKAKALPDGTQELFQRIFGARHFSLKCFARSVAFSLSAMSFIALLIFLVYPTRFWEMKDIFLGNEPVPDDSDDVGQIVRAIFPHGWWYIFGWWLAFSILLDYLSLLKTRLILRLLTRMHFQIYSTDTYTDDGFSCLLCNVCYDDPISIRKYVWNAGIIVRYRPSYGIYL